MLADLITFSRILFSALMIFFSPQSAPFGISYLLAGISDVLDGPIARKQHTESHKGAVLDSVADAAFLTVTAIKVKPLLTFPSWLWIWIIAVAFLKTAGLFVMYLKLGTWTFPHSVMNKMTGFCLFLAIPITVCRNVLLPAIVTAVLATVSLFQDVYCIQTTSENDPKRNPPPK